MQLNQLIQAAGNAVMHAYAEYANMADMGDCSQRTWQLQGLGANICRRHI